MNIINNNKIPHKAHSAPNSNVNSSSSSNESTLIDMQALPKNKHRKNLKVKAFCGRCYQFFQNGPLSKICQDHLNKNCNILPCKKKHKNNNNECVRKFANINSANRHTHCLKKEDVAGWNKKCDIQNCLGIKRGNDEKIDDVLVHINVNETEKKNENVHVEKEGDKNDKNEINANDESSNNHFKTNNLIGLIDQIDQINFHEDDFEFNQLFNFSMNDHNNTNQNNNNNQKHPPITSTNQNNIINNSNNNYFDISNSKKEVYQCETNKINNNDTIEVFFDIIQKNANISNTIKKKLIKAFKKKGILNVRVLKLFYDKNKNCDFLIEQFKNVTSQIEGVSLCIEYLLKESNKLINNM